MSRLFVGSLLDRHAHVQLHKIMQHSLLWQLQMINLLQKWKFYTRDYRDFLPEQWLYRQCCRVPFTVQRRKNRKREERETKCQSKEHIDLSAPSKHGPFDDSAIKNTHAHNIKLFLTFGNDVNHFLISNRRLTFTLLKSCFFCVLQLCQ